MGGRLTRSFAMLIRFTRVKKKNRGNFSFKMEKKKKGKKQKNLQKAQH